MSNSTELTPIKRRWPKILLVLVFLFLLTVIGLVVLATLSAPFQTTLIQKYLDRTNAKMEESIMIDEVKFHPINGAVINNLLILDDHQDTLLYAQEFYSGLTDNLLTLLSGKLSLSNVTLANTQVNIVTKTNETESNLARFIGQFVDKSTENTDAQFKFNTNNSQLVISVDQVKISDLLLNQINEVSGKSVVGGIESLMIDVENIDLTDHLISLSSLKIERPSLAFEYVTPINHDDNISEAPPILTQGQDSVEATTWEVSLGMFRLINGEFTNQSDAIIEVTNPHPHIKYNNLGVSNVNISVNSLITNIQDDISAEDFTMSGVVDGDKKTYEIGFRDLKMGPEEGDIVGLDIKAGSSRLKTNAELIYDDFKNFNRFADKVFLNLNLDGSTISFLDIAYFLPKLNTAPWIEKNISKTVKLSGQIKGRINNFSSKKIAIEVSDEVTFNGTVRIKDILDPDQAFLSIRTDQLRTSIQQLKRLIPGFSPPENYDKLGNIIYSGTFTGFTYDFVTNGTLKTSIGEAILDTRLDLKPGPTNALYSGKIDLINFDLETWTGNSDFGLMSATSTVRNGKGLLIDYIKADLNASLSRFEYRDYTYTNIELKGVFNENQFNGEFGIEDENIDFNFNGLVNIKDGKITTKLEAFADKLDLRKLNLSDDELIVQGDFDLNLSGTSVEDIAGNANIGSVNIFYKDKIYYFDTISVINNILPSGERDLTLKSDYVNLQIDGVFDPSNLPYHFTYTLSQNHPLWWEKLQLKQAVKRNEKVVEDFDFELNIKDSKEFSDILNIGCFNVQNLNAEGRISTAKTKWDIETTFDQLSCDSLILNDIDYSLTYLNGRGKTNLKIKEWFNGEQRFPQLLMTGNLNGDELEINISTSEIFDSIGVVDLTVEGYPKGDDIFIKVNSNHLEMLGNEWTISPENEVLLGNKLIDVNGFSLSDGERNVIINDLDQKGVRVTLEAFNLDFINDLINYQNIYFSGEGDVSVLVDNIFDRGKFWTEVKMPSILLNTDDYGEVTVKAGTRDFETYEGLVNIIRKEDNQRIEADFEITRSTEAFNAFLKAENVDLDLFEYIIADGTSGTAGRLDLNATITGTLQDFVLEGDALLRDGRSRVDYLGTDIFFDQQRFRITNTMVDLTGVEIKDADGNVATIQGGLRHVLLKDFVADAVLSSPKFIGLNTTKEINPTYYGKVIGDLDINFQGPFQSIDITVSGTSLPGTELNIPVESSKVGYEESFITFVEKEELIKSIIDTTLVVEEAGVLGMNIEMNLDVTPDANVKLIFNERLNDIISATGRGNLQVISTRTGDFNIYGNYEIESGDYLFTAWGFLAKPFKVNRGSYITWTGDPFNANLNIDAVLENMRAPLYTFIQEYLTDENSDIEQTSKKRTDIDLKMKLRGLLYSPEVSFDLDFPNVDPVLRSYVDSKMRTLRQNEADLNDQVAALLIFQSFIPSNNQLGSSFFNANNLAYSGINTLSEFVSSQISFQLSNLLQQAIVDNKYLSSIDFELAFANNSVFEDGQFETDLLPDEIGVNLRSTLKNDRWGIEAGTNYIRNNELTNDQFTTQDFTVEYAITDDRRLKLRVYSENDYDIVGTGSFEREQRYGVGISYRKEFGSFNDLQSELDKSIKKAEREARRRK